MERRQFFLTLFLAILVLALAAAVYLFADIRTVDMPWMDARALRAPEPKGVIAFGKAQNAGRMPAPQEASNKDASTGLKKTSVFVVQAVQASCLHSFRYKS